MRRALQLDEALGHAATDKRLEILRRVGACGSISQAARDAGVSYKAAWQALDMLANLAGVPLVEKVVGGAGGGGARLTAAGEQLLRVGDEMARARREVLARLAAPGATPAVAALGLRTSMRNQLPCTVAALEASGPLLRVVLQLPDGTLAARITAESGQLLGLQPGVPLLALCKATAVQVARAPAGRTRSGVNLLQGRATRVARGAAGDEVAAQLPGGAALVGFAAARSGLRAGSAVVLQMDEAAVVLALAG